MGAVRYLIAAAAAVGMTLAVGLLIAYLAGALLGDTEKVSVSTCTFGPGQKQGVSVWEGDQQVDCVPADDAPELVEWLRGFFSAAGLKEEEDETQRSLVERDFVFDRERRSEREAGSAGDE